MEKRRISINPLWLSFALTAAFVWVQIASVYGLAANESHRQYAIYMPAVALILALGLVALNTALSHRGGLLFWGESSMPLGFTGVVAGADLLLLSGQQAWNYFQSGVAPAPYYTIFSEADKLFFYGTLLFGILGGLAILIFGFLWMFGGKVGSVACQWLSIAPILWAACRLARYVMSYSSTVRNAYSSAQAAMLILSLYFFYVFGQHLNGRLKLTGAQLPISAFVFGISAIATFGAQWYIRTYSSSLIAGVVAVADVSDLLCGVFALAVGAVVCSKKAAEKTEEYKQAKDAEKLASILGTEDATVPLVGTEASAIESAEASVIETEEMPAAEALAEAANEAAEEAASAEEDAAAFLQMLAQSESLSENGEAEEPQE